MSSSETNINWTDIDTILLDMDGTVLDLAFDNYFWLELLPQHVADKRGISLVAAREQMRAHTARTLGSLQWYCIDHWSEQLDLDVAAIKRASRHRIGYLPGALEFLLRARRSPLRVVIVTNAHPRTLAIKLSQTHLDRHVDAVYSSHEFGHPKESADFWPRFGSAAALRLERSVLIDDSAAVVAAARNQGLGGVLAITRPDSSQPQRNLSDGPAIESLAHLESSLPAD
jgi:HAD superfamily hydrolase (TIGR01509 family)